MKSLLLIFAFINIMITYGQRTGGGGGKGPVATSSPIFTTEADIFTTIITPMPTTPTASPTTPAPTWPLIATTEICSLVSYNTRTCSCGTMCSSYSREYFAVCAEKCGNQVLRTGEFGKETCDLNDFFAKDMRKNYTVIAMPCEDGEFAFADDASKLNIGFLTFAILYFCTLNGINLDLF